jgi:DnaJ family protein A protein 3
MAGLTAPATRLLLAAARAALARPLHHRTPDYYAILGVANHAQLDDIKFAYFNMAKKFHPENNRTLDAKQMFDLVAEAYDVLSDSERRARYDETGLSEDRFGGTSGGPGRQASDSTYTAEQMYQTIFGRSAQEAEQEEHVHEDFAESHAGSSGVSSEYIVQVSAEEAVRGVQVGVQLRLAGVCNKCQGTRAELGYTGGPCPYCEGTGQETVRSGHITARKTCSYCQGEKIFIKFKCIECEGVGRKMFDLYHPVDIPAGTLHGEVLRMDVDQEYLDRVSGFDWDGLDDRPRTLFVTVDVAASDKFSLDGRDIVACLELGPALALLGGAVPFPSPRGRCLQVTVRPGTPSHAAVVVPGEGLPGTDSLPGDLVLRTAIRAPGRLTWRQARIWRRFAETEAGGEAGVGLVEGVASELDHRCSLRYSCR